MRAYIEIDSKKLQDNYKKIKEYVKKDIIAVIKDNAYGHGLIEIALLLAKLSTKYLAVATLQEAILIRKNLIFTPILLLGREDNFNLIYSYKLTVTITCLEHLTILSKSKYPIMCHLLIDTGMMRDGIMPDEVNEALGIIKNSRLLLKGIFTHFSSTNNFKKQYSLFEEILKLFPDKSLIIHSQSTSTINEDCPKCNAVRIGLALYGYGNANLKLEPILSLKSPILRIQKVKANTSIGYEESEYTKQNGFILTIPYGYGDGVICHNKNLGYIDNFYIPQIGRICMDHTMMFSPRPIKEKTIELIGEHLPLLDLAEILQTIPYEILAHLSSRLKRIVI